METTDKATKLGTWMRAHPNITASAVIGAAGAVGYLIGGRRVNSRIDQAVTALEDQIQETIDTFGEANMLVRRQGYKWVIKNLET